VLSQKTLQLTTKVLTKNLAKIKNAFPTLPVEFYDVLCERLKEKDFDDERMTKTVNGVIDTCKYPTPTIAHFITYDKEYSCPFSFTFGLDYGKYSGCDDCERYEPKLWWRCKLEHTMIKKK